MRANGPGDPPVSLFPGLGDSGQSETTLVPLFFRGASDRSANDRSVHCEDGGLVADGK